MIVYKCTNNLTNQCYIGQTTNTLHDRIVDHKYEANVRQRNNKFHKALREYGFDNFEWEIVARAKNPIKLSEMEKKFIKKYNSIENGYNTQLREDIKYKT